MKNTRLTLRAIVDKMDDRLWMVNFRGKTFIVTQTDLTTFKIYQRGVFKPIHVAQVDYGIEDVINWIEERK